MQGKQLNVIDNIKMFITTSFSVWNQILDVKYDDSK